MLGMVAVLPTSANWKTPCCAATSKVEANRGWKASMYGPAGYEIGGSARSVRRSNTLTSGSIR